MTRKGSEKNQKGTRKAQTLVISKDRRHCIWSNICTRDPEDPRFHLCCAVCKAEGLSTSCEEACIDYNNGTCDYLASRDFIEDLIARRTMFAKSKEATNTEINTSKKLDTQTNLRSQEAKKNV